MSCLTARVNVVPFAIMMALTCLAPKARCQTTQSGGTVPPKRLTSALGCLVAANFVQDILKSLDLHVGDYAWAQMHVGSAPTLSQSSDVVYVALYSADERRGWLLVAEPNDQGSFLAIRNGYRLAREGSRWRADEGNGGSGMYDLMSRFATRISHTHRYRVRLVKGESSCTMAQ